MKDDKLPAVHRDDSLPARHEQGPDHRLTFLKSGQAIESALTENPAATTQNEIDLLAYWQLLVKRRWLILGIIAAAFGLSLVGTLLTAPVYRATAVIQIEKDGIQVMDARGVVQTDVDYDSSYNQTQFGLLRSHSLAKRVAEDLGLVDSDIATRLRSPTWWQRLRSVLGLGGSATTTSGTVKTEVIGSTEVSREAKLRAAGGIVEGGLTIDPVRDSHLVRLNYDSVIPSFSAQVANAVADGFIASTMDRQFGASSYAKKYLEDQLAQLKSRLEESERALVAFAQKDAIVPTKEGGSLASENLSELNSSLAKIQEQRIKSEARWKAAKVANGKAMPAEMLSSPVLQTLLTQQATLQAQYQDKLQTFKPDYPEMLALKAQIEGVQKQLSGELDSIRASAKAEFDAAVDQEVMLEQKLEKLQAHALDIDNRSIQYNILKRDADTNRQLYNALLQRYKEIGITGGAKSSNISIIDRAEVPTGPYSPNLLNNLAYGTFAGAIISILLALLLDFLDDTLRTPLDIEKHLHLPVLGIIPKVVRETPEHAQKDSRSPFSESYRSVRTALQFSTDRGTPKVLLITSPAAGEGKSTAALTLARGLSQLGKRVLLIEGDMRRPSLAKTLNITAENGLSNLLAGGCGLAQTLVKTDDPNLDLMLSGPIPPNPTELLSGPKMISLLLMAGEKYEQIIIDGPPVLGIADAPVLANIATGTLLVTKSGSTRISSAKSSIRRLWTAHARMIGVMINQYNYKTVAYGYNYYGYSYGDKLKLTKS